MRVLFLTIPFYEYIEKIKDSIRKNYNCEVDVMFTSMNYKNLKGIESLKYYYAQKNSKEFYDDIEKKRQHQEFSLLKRHKYDYIFVLVGKGLKIDEYKLFLTTQPNAKKILYLWDDVARVQEFQHYRSLFDIIYSFDKMDCNKYGLNFLPLFYTQEYEYDNEIKRYDFSFTGWLHSERERFVEDIYKENSQRKWCVWLRTTRLHVIYEFLLTFGKKRPSKFYKYKDLSMAESALLMKNSRIVIDMPYAHQNGLSIRTIESLAAQCKLITTNKEVKSYDFYNDNNILIVERHNPVIPETFINKEYIDVPSYIKERYSLNNWIKVIFES